jgi:hypothetical protein
VSDIELTLKLERDSDNSYPGRAYVRVEGDTIRFDLPGPDRTIAFNLRRLKRAIETLEEEAEESGS